MERRVCREVYGCDVRRAKCRDYVCSASDSQRLRLVDRSGKWTSVSHFFSSVFLPQGYPDSVSDDYLTYQIWDTVQAFCSSITGTLATHALLQGVGVGDESATVLAATMTWLMKDGTGMLGRIVFAWMQGSYLDCDCKRWRLFADILNDFAICIEILAPYFQAYFRLVVCIAGVCKSIVGTAGGATRAALTLHQARRNNMADVSAKDGSQETLVNLAALLCSLVLVPVVSENHSLIWLLFVIFTLLHLVANYKAVTCVTMAMLNQARLHLVAQDYFASGCTQITSVKDVNGREPVLWKTRRRFSIQMGCSVDRLVHSYTEFQKLVKIYAGHNFLLNVDLKSNSIYVTLNEDSSVDDQLAACFEAEILEFAARRASASSESEALDRRFSSHWDNIIEAYRHGDAVSMVTHTHALAQKVYKEFKGQLSRQGWVTDHVLLCADEWRAQWDLEGIQDKKLF